MRHEWIQGFECVLFENWVGLLKKREHAGSGGLRTGGHLADECKGQVQYACSTRHLHANLSTRRPLPTFHAPRQFRRNRSLPCALFILPIPSNVSPRPQRSRSRSQRLEGSLLLSRRRRPLLGVGRQAQGRQGARRWCVVDRCLTRVHHRGLTVFQKPPNCGGRSGA